MAEQSFYSDIWFGSRAGSRGGGNLPFWDAWFYWGGKFWLDSQMSKIDPLILNISVADDKNAKCKMSVSQNVTLKKCLLKQKMHQ